MSPPDQIKGDIPIYPTVRTRICWVTWQPTPYHSYFFKHLAQEPTVDCLVNFIKDVISSHPWKSLELEGYSSRFCELRMGVDWRLIWRALAEKDTFFVVVGWNQKTFLLLLCSLRLLHRHYAMWTDTPKLSTERPILLGWARARFLRWIFSGAVAVMGTGTCATTALSKMGAPMDRLVNLPTFPDLDALKRLEGKECGRGHVVRLISAGYIVNARKGHDVALRALGRVAGMGIGIPFEYAIAGTGPDLDNLRQLARDLGLEKNVKFLGWLEADGVRALYREACLLIHPSPVHDPYPNAVLDGMAAGLAVFISDACGQAQNDRVADGVNGFIHRAGDTDQLAEQLTRALRNPRLLLEVGRKARETAEQWPVERGVNIIKELASSCAAS
ncbi:MAG: glycosyltransferase family 4 protein [Candidatus Competibacteraceae bacterium]